MGIPLVRAAVQGQNATVLAYGQTGAGKTFTIFGTPDQPGVFPRAGVEIFQLIQEENDMFDHVVLVSVLELYCNNLLDLLAEQGRNLNVRIETGGTVMVENLVEETCASAAHMHECLERAHERRTVAATMMNSESSRSHLIVMAKVVKTNRITHERTLGKFTLLDLAGSERLKKS